MEQIVVKAKSEDGKRIRLTLDPGGQARESRKAHYQFCRLDIDADTLTVRMRNGKIFDSKKLCPKSLIDERAMKYRISAKPDEMPRLKDWAEKWNEAHSEKHTISEAQARQERYSGLRHSEEFGYHSGHPGLFPG